MSRSNTFQCASLLIFFQECEISNLLGEGECVGCVDE